MHGDSIKEATRLHRIGNIEGAIKTCKSLLRISSRHAGATSLLAIIHHQAGRHGEAEVLVRGLIDTLPNSPVAHNNIGVTLVRLKRFDETEKHFRTAIRLRPNFSPPHNNLGALLEKLGRLEEAQTVLRKALELKPNYAEAHNHLGNVLRMMGRMTEAVLQHNKALQTNPNYAEAYVGLATIYSETGQVIKAIECHRKIVALRPKCEHSHSNLIFMLHYDPAVTPQQLFDEHVAWGRKHAERFYSKMESTGKTHRGSVGVDVTHRRVRLGYVSCDFRAHPVARFIEPALEHHDKSKFEVFLYSAVTEPDGVTERIKKYGHHWRDITKLTDDQAAQLIRDDKIDILVDLMGHIGGHRLLIFARKPAPVQFTYLGYPDTTGMQTIDYRITDSWHDPVVGQKSPHSNPLPEYRGRE